MSDPATPDAGTSTKTRLALSLQRRVGRSTLLLVALAVLVTGLGGYLATRINVYGSVDRVVDSVADAAVKTLGPSPDRAAVRRYASTSVEVGLVAAVVIESDGTVFTPQGSAVLPVDAHDVAAAGGAGSAIRTVTATSGVHYRVRAVPVGDRPGFALLVGRPLTNARQILGALALSLVAFGAIAVVTAGLIGRRVARAGIAPVRQLTAEVEQRAAAEDLKPVQVVSDDEIGRLGAAFNHLLDVIKVSRVRQARLVADAGHELRTPLTSMRTNIELLTADTERSMLRTDDRLAIMRDVRTQLIEFSNLVSDLIGLTRVDRTAADFEEIDLTTVLEEVVDRVSMQSTGLSWAVELDPAYLQGDGDLLSRAFGNVLDNAVKFTPPGGTVTVTLHGDEVRIADTGVGVHAEDRPFVFDRFFRSETARATPGTGLGLSITDSVVRQHGGSVTVTDASGGGAMFVLRFPGATRLSRRALDAERAVAVVALQ